MSEAQMFGECLSDLMHKNHISVARLTQWVNYRSKTSLARLLRDEVRYCSIADFMSRLEQAEGSLFSEREMERLREAMEVSRLGRGRWRTYRGIWQFLRGSDAQRQVSIERFGKAQACSAQELTEKWHDARRLDILMINAGLDSFMSQVERLLVERPDLPCTVRHYLIMREEAGSMAVQLGALMRVLHDARYQVYCRVARQGAGEDGPGDRYHLVLVEGENSDGSSFFQMINLKNSDQWLLYENENVEMLMPFVNSFLSDLWQNVLALKVEYPESGLLEGLTAISKRYLSCERERGTCCLAPNVCFELIPMEILYEVMFDSALRECKADTEAVCALCEVHRARYENIYNKKEQTIFIFSREGMERFVRTGRTTDHVAGMRPFTAAERRRILDDLIEKSGQSQTVGIYILRPEIRIREMTLTTHDGLGVYMLDSFTQYDVQNGHSEAFVSVPMLAQMLDDFFRDELIGKCTYSKEESLDILCAMRDSIGE